MIYAFHPASAPLLISVPHAGTRLSSTVERTMTASGRARVDTDWHVHRLVDFAVQMGAGLIQAEYSRYMVDLNRPPDDQPLYEQAGTGLVATETFDGQPLYEPGLQPERTAIERRVEEYWRPYHQQIESELDRIRRKYRYAIVFDAHSIASRVPRLFEGRLPDLNLGTYDGRSCDGQLEAHVSRLLHGQDRFSAVVNGRFKGGYITRHYGRPDQGIHALQLEIAQACYMDETQPEVWEEGRAEPLKSLLGDLFGCLLDWRPA